MQTEIYDLIRERQKKRNRVVFSYQLPYKAYPGLMEELPWLVLLEWLGGS